MEEKEQDPSLEWEQELTELRALIKTAGWKRLEKFIEAQVKRRTGELRRPLATRDETLGQEFLKGEIEALELIAKYPEFRIALLDEEVKAKIEEKEHARENRESADFGVPGGDEYVEF